MTNFVLDLYTIIAEFYLISSVCVLLVFGVLLSTSKELGYPLVGFTTSLLCTQILFFTFNLVFFSFYLNNTPWNYILIQDYFSLNIKILTLIFSICWLFLVSTYTQTEKINAFEFWILILLAIIAFLFILQSYDTLSLYLSVEFQSLIFYILASFKRTSEFSTEAGLKYFILGAFSSALLLFGLSILYILTGITNFGDFSKFFTGILTDDQFFYTGILIGLIFIGTAFLFKLSAAPFHMWSPDVYEGSPTAITFFFSVFPKLVIFVVMVRVFMVSFYDFFFIWKNLFIFASISSIFVGSFGALAQNKWKRFLAYSSISHVGFMLISVLNGEMIGIVGLLTYLIIYIITTFATFSILMSFRILVYPDHYQTRYLVDLESLSKLNPSLSLALTLVLFSMAGIPPLSGFFAKVLVILPTLQNNFYIVAIFSVIMSCISCFYYIRLIKLMYFSYPELYLITFSIEKSMALTISFCTSFILFLFLDLEIVSIFSFCTSFSFLH
uniref:NADH dehydrogenase subunit 2 n=1 Tax=Sporolithon durum TaxID=48970 RepID=V9P5G4_9FLOR|nr:NADH dehydrogenase subunit 2 [Sporolithon durum]AGU16688.1 NADH dehydrogenase subunit 2 [Sporolithon durum]